MKIYTVFRRVGWGLAASSVCCGAFASALEKVPRTRGGFASRGNAEEVSTAKPEVPLSMSSNLQQPQRDLRDACKYGCEALPCEGGCQSAFAKCNHFVPLCFTNRTEQFFNATVQWGWSNPIVCHGGSIECDLWIGAVDCNTTAPDSQVIGTVRVSTDDNHVLYEINDEAYRISSVQVFVGLTEVPFMNASGYSISPEDFTVQFWFDPKVKGARVDPIKKVTPRMYLIAHANVCPTDPVDEVPKVWLPPVNSTDPLCPIQAPYLCSEGIPTPAPSVFSSSNVLQPKASYVPESPAPSYVPTSEPTSVDGGSTSLPLVDFSTCPFKCGSLSCGDGCLDSFASCPGAMCLGSDPAGLATWGHSNPINCTGGSLQCELWTGEDCNHTNGELIGHLHIDTDGNKVTFDLNNGSDWAITSAHIYVGTSSNFEPFVQDAWFDPRQKDAVVEMSPDIHAGVFVIAQAIVCPSSSVSPDLPTTPPNETVMSCLVPRQVPCPSSSPTSALATKPPKALVENLVEPFVDSLVDLFVNQSQAEASDPPSLFDNLFASPLPTREPGRPTPTQTRPPTPSTASPARQPTAPPVRPAPTPSGPTPSPVGSPTGSTKPPTKPPTPKPTRPPTEQPTRRSETPTETPTESPTEPPTEPPTQPPTDPPTESTTAPPSRPTEPPALFLTDERTPPERKSKRRP
jgi:hypothetical protein